MKSLGTVFLLLAVGLAGCTSGADGSDADGDGLEDGLERSGWSSQIVEFMDRRVEVVFASDPTKVDTDGDGLTDQQEFFLRTSPAQKDTDQDGLTDCQEAFHTNTTECEDPAWDTDNADGGTGTDPRKADSDPGPSSYKLAQPWTDETGVIQSSDGRWGDGLSDGFEWNGFDVTLGERQRFVRTDPRSPDTDGDGAEDAYEIIMLGSDPTVADSDGDGCLDARDPWPTRNPLLTPGLQELTLVQTPESESAEVRLTVQFWGHVSVLPDGDAHAMESGDTWLLSASSVTVVASQKCTVHFLNPWTEIQFTVYDQRSGQQLDVTSDHLAKGAIWWNPFEGTFSRTAAGPLLNADSFRFSGVHGSIEMAPGVAD